MQAWISDFPSRCKVGLLRPPEADIRPRRAYWLLFVGGVVVILAILNMIIDMSLVGWSILSVAGLGIMVQGVTELLRSVRRGVTVTLRLAGTVVVLVAAGVWVSGPFLENSPLVLATVFYALVVWAQLEYLFANRELGRN